MMTRPTVLVRQSRDYGISEVFPARAQYPVEQQASPPLSIHIAHIYRNLGNIGNIVSELTTFSVSVSATSTCFSVLISPLESSTNGF